MELKSSGGDIEMTLNGATEDEIEKNSICGMTGDMKVIFRTQVGGTGDGGKLEMEKEYTVSSCNLT